ncbi:MAG: glycosyltransferase family 39 protein [Candidatus Roizmanbacteria bacterium]|nr:MAG: glycosyltransferase family 39 protein [Candidatus Roizmanbacteria bacterium]
MMNFIFQNTHLKLLVQSFWRDEAFSYILASQNIFQLLIATAKDFNPPLYYIILKFWMLIFGSSEIALRSLSIIFYWATLYTVYLFLNEIMKLNTRKSVIYLIFFIFNPLLIYYAFEARMYTMFAFLATLSFYAFHQRKITLYKVITTLGLYTHYFMILAVLAQFVYAFIMERGKIHFRYLLKQMLFPLIFFLPWVLFVFTQKKILAESFWITTPKLGDILLIPSQIFTGYEKDFGFLSSKFPSTSFLLLISMFLIGLLLLGYKKIKSDRYENVYSLFILFFYWTFIPSLLIFVISFFKPLFLPRYLIFTNIGLYLLIILALEQIKIKPRLLLIFILLLMCFVYNSMELKYRVKSDYAKTFKEIKSLSQKNDVVYVTSELDFFTAQYYFDKNRVYIFEKPYEEIPPYVGKALIPKEKVVNQLPLYPKKAFILKPDLSYTIQSLY